MSMEDGTRVNDAAHEQELELDLRELWRALMRRKWIIIALFLGACIIAYVASNAMTPIYEATTTILVRDQSGGLENLLLDGSRGSGNALQQSVELFQSRTLALRAARQMGYDWDEYSPEFRAFRGSISVQPVSSSDMIRISVQHEDPVEAQEIANQLVRAFIDRRQEMNSEDIRQARLFIEQQMMQYEAELEQAENDLVRYQEQVEIVTPSGETAAVLENIYRLDTLRAEALVAREQTQQRLLSLQGDMEEDRRSVVSGSVVSSNPVISGFRSQLANLEVELAAALEQYTDRHPRVVALQAQINELRSELDREIGRLQAEDAGTRMSEEVITLEAELVGLNARIDALDRLIAEREALFGDLPQKELHLTRLIRNAEVTENIYIMLRSRYEEMRISEAMEAANVSVLDPAIAPRNPIKPRKQLNVAIAGFLGIFVGVGIAFLLEYLDTSFKDVDELEAYLGMPILGRIPEFEESEAIQNGKVSEVPKIAPRV